MLYDILGRVISLHDILGQPSTTCNIPLNRKGCHLVDIIPMASQVRGQLQNIADLREPKFKGSRQANSFSDVLSSFSPYASPQGQTLFRTVFGSGASQRRTICSEWALFASLNEDSLANSQKCQEFLPYTL